MRAQLIGLGLWAMACSPVAPANVSPVRSHALSPPTALSSPAPSASATGDASAGPGTSPAEPSATQSTPAPLAEPPRLPLLVLEPPYSALGHPRLATEMLTLARDEELFQWALGGTSDPQHPSNQPGYHPATRVVVDVQLLSRAPLGATNRLQHLARSTGYWPLRACFETAQRLAIKTQRSARVRLTLGASGKVLGSRSLGPTPERDYARCVLERMRELDFTPGFSRKLDVEINVKQWPGHAPVPPHAPDAASTLHLSNDASAAFEGLAPTLTACYLKGLADDAKLWGRIALRLQVGSDGAIRKAEPVETRFPNAQVVACARQAMLGAHVSSPGVSELTFAVRLGQGPPAAPAMPESPPAPAPPAPQ